MLQLAFALMMVSNGQAQAVPPPAVQQAPSAPAAQAATSRDCANEGAPNVGEVAAGAAASVALGALLGGGGVRGTVTLATIPLTSFLVDSFINLLDCRERLQAVAATIQAADEAERDGQPVAVVWRSDTRPNVTGRSVVTAIDPARPRVPRCMTVTDIVIIDGQETVAPKRMCRTPPSTRWLRA